jgi:hypothetical protein
MKRITPLLLFSASVAVGCTQLEDSRIEARQRRMARAAYVTSPGACNGMPHSVDYAQGFEAGYYDVASGGDGCPPPLPPKKYWRATYNSPVGQEHVKAWFQGFRDGAAAAKADGVASYGTIYVSDEHRNGLKRAAQVPPVVVPPGAPPRVLTPSIPIPPPGTSQEVPIHGPNAGPVPTDGAQLKPSTSDSQDSSEQGWELTKPHPLKSTNTAWKPTRKAATGSSTITPVMAPTAADEAAPIPAVSTPAKASTAQPSAMPVRLKLPDLELPAGFAPEAGLGDPTTLRSKE